MRLALLAVTLATACRTGAPSTPSEASPDFLVWSIADDAPAVTRWLAADGTERGRADGIFIAAGDAVWQVKYTAHTITTKGCSMSDDSKPEPGTAHVVDLSLVSADGKTDLVVIRTDPAILDESATYDHTVRLRASLGPLVFGEEASDEFACGAHGTVIVNAFTYDLDGRTHRPFDVRPPPPELGPRIRAAFEREAIEGMDVDSPISLGESLPVWRDGALQARHLAVVDTCYACGNGEWSSYTSAAWVDDVRIPDAWAIAREVPPAVIAQIGNPGVNPTGVSWGVPDPSWRKVLGP